MPRKGQLTKGEWKKCLNCKEDFWAENNRLKRYDVKLCSWKCRIEWRNGLGEKKALIIKLYREGKSISEINFLLNGSRHCRQGIRGLLTDNEIKIRPNAYYHKEEKNTNWKGGVCIKDGYRWIRDKGVAKAEHRFIMGEFLKRKIDKQEHVHHLNGIKTDNRIENLALLTREIHGGVSAKQYNDWKQMYQSRIVELESIITKQQ